MRTEHLSFAATGDPGWGRYAPHERATRVNDAERAWFRAAIRRRDPGHPWLDRLRMAPD